MRWPELLRRITWQHVAITFASLTFLAFLAAIRLANQHGDDRVAVQQDYQSNCATQIDTLTRQVEKLAMEVANSKGEAERAKVQANTSVDQLVKAGEPPIVAAPEVVTVPTSIPVTTTTTVIRPSTTTTTNTSAPPTMTTTTTTTTTEPPPESTTTTLAPATDPPSETTTTTEVP